LFPTNNIAVLLTKLAKISEHEVLLSRDIGIFRRLTHIQNERVRLCALSKISIIWQTVLASRGGNLICGRLSFLAEGLPILNFP
jgi:hypothetical protein